jgi:hypothetical protein
MTGPAPKAPSSTPRRPSAARGAGCTITVCRGCCCGNDRKHPGIDHAGQLNRLRRQLAREVRVRLAEDCVGPCSRANVIVVSPSRGGRAAGGRPVWLGFVRSNDVIDDISAWANAGGPGIAELPAILELHVFTPPKRPHPTSGSAGAAAPP